MNAAQQHAEMVDAMKANGRELNAEDISHHFGAGVYVKQVRIRAGLVVMSHQHEHDHLSILASGHVRVVTDKGVAVYAGPAVIEIRAGLNHAVHALQDSIWFCVHATDETDPETIDQILIQKDPQ